MVRKSLWREGFGGKDHLYQARCFVIHCQKGTLIEVWHHWDREKSERQVQEMGVLLRSYMETEENTKKLEGEMQDAVHEMRWVMRLHESRTGQAPMVPERQSSSQQPAQKSKGKQVKESPSKLKKQMNGGGGGGGGVVPI